MSNKLILIRHGETNHNKKGLLQGMINTKLNEKGKRQSLEVAKKINNLSVTDISIDGVFCSPLYRALQTYDIIMKNINEKPSSLLTFFDYRLREINIGSLANKKKEDVSVDLMNNSPDGEPATLVMERIKSFINYIKNNFNNKTFLIISHNYVLKLLISYVEKGFFDEKVIGETMIKNGELKIVEV